MAAALLSVCLSAPVHAGVAANTSVIKDYLDLCSPEADASCVAPGASHAADGSGKVVYDCHTGNIILRAHGMAAGKTFELRSGHAGAEGDEVIVGSATAQDGDSVLIKARQPLGTLGESWTLWLVADDGPATRVLQGHRSHCASE